MGLDRKSFMPAARHWSRSWFMALAVMATMGKLARPGMARMARVASSPSMTGICMSISTMS